VIGFGLLLFSHIPVLAALGATVAPGAFLALLFGQCWRAATSRVPSGIIWARHMRSILRPAVAAAAAPTCMVWLPGAYHAAQDFLTAGFAEAVRARQLDLDLIFVDMELAHVGDRGVLARLRSDIVLPALAAGIKLWMGGISLGGSLHSTMPPRIPLELAGLCLLAPYLGNRILAAEIVQARGLAAWQPGELAETDEERRIWRYIKSRRAGARPLYLDTAREIAFPRRMSCWRTRCLQMR